MDQAPPPPTSDVPAMPAGDPTPAPEPARSRGVTVAIVAVVAVLGIAAVGGAAAFFLLRGSGEQLLDKVPASADVVAAVYLDPSAGQKTNLFRLADEIPALGTRDELVGRAQDTLDGLLSGAGLTHEDIEWVGAEVAVSVTLPDDGTEPGVVVLIDSDDEEAASQTLTKLREDDAGGDWETTDHDGVEVWAATRDTLDAGAYAIVDGVVVASNDVAMVEEVIDVTHGTGEAIVDDAAFTETTSALPDGKLGLVYFNPSDLSDRVADLQGLGSVADVDETLASIDAFTGLAMSVSAESDGIAVDAEVSIDPAKLSDALRDSLSLEAAPNALLSDVPENALAVLAQQGLEASIADSVNQIETFAPELAELLSDTGVTGDGGAIDSLTGDVVVAAMPGAETPTGALYLGTSDEAALADAAQALTDEITPTQIASGTGVTDLPAVSWEMKDYQGVQVHTLVDPANPSPFQPSYAVFDGVGVIGITQEAVHAAIDTNRGGTSITSSAAYAAAMDGMPEGNQSLYVDIDGIADAIRTQLPSQDQLDEFNEFAGTTMDHLDSLAVGSEQSEDHVHVRVFLRVVT